MNEEQLQEGRGNGLFTPKNLVILLIGIVLGYFLKLQALQTVTIGYDDYKLQQWNKEPIKGATENKGDETTKSTSTKSNRTVDGGSKTNPDNKTELNSDKSLPSEKTEKR